MTRTEALETLKEMAFTATETQRRALEDAISALSADGDFISRQAVLNTLDNMDKALDEERTVENYKELLTECIKVLPSAENKGDLISRQVVLDELEKLDWQELYLPIHFKQILDDVPSVENKGEWIPVSSGELPKIGQRVLATIETYDDGLKVVDTMYDKRGFMCGNALAWQPLPAPYKPEKGGE